MRNDLRAQRPRIYHLAFTWSYVTILSDKIFGMNNFSNVLKDYSMKKILVLPELLPKPDFFSKSDIRAYEHTTNRVKSNKSGARRLSLMPRKIPEILVSHDLFHFKFTYLL